MPKKIRWGILGAGNIAKAFAKGLGEIPDAELVAIGSRSAEKAETFGAEFHIPHRHASYEALAEDSTVDAVYVATPHTRHKEHTLLCLNAGKAVLCEKPFAINAQEAQAMVACARRKKLFLMEAMWTRCLPVIREVRQWIAAGRIGEPRMVMADFGFRAGFDPQSRLFDLRLGGGALLDVGIYPVSFAALVFGEQPTRITGMAEIGKSGADEQSAMILGYKGGQLAVLATAIRTTTPQTATILGTEGHIVIPGFWHGTTATLYAGGKEEKIQPPFVGNGYNYEAVEVMRCLRARKKESAIIPLEESLAILRTMDKIRAQWGLVYPTERRQKRGRQS